MFLKSDKYWKITQKSSTDLKTAVLMWTSLWVFVGSVSAVRRSGDGSWSAATSRSWRSCCHPTWATLPVSALSPKSATSSRALWTKSSRSNGVSRVRKNVFCTVSPQFLSNIMLFNFLYNFLCNYNVNQKKIIKHFM